MKPSFICLSAAALALALALPASGAMAASSASATAPVTANLIGDISIEVVRGLNYADVAISNSEDCTYEMGWASSTGLRQDPIVGSAGGATCSRTRANWDFGAFEINRPTNTPVTIMLTAVDNPNHPSVYGLNGDSIGVDATFMCGPASGPQDAEFTAWVAAGGVRDVIDVSSGAGTFGDTCSSSPKMVVNFGGKLFVPKASGPIGANTQVGTVTLTGNL